MSDETGTPTTPAPELKKRDPTLLILLIILVLIIVCCVCVAAGAWILWENGDEWFGPLISDLIQRFG